MVINEIRRKIKKVGGEGVANLCRAVRVILSKGQKAVRPSHRVDSVGGVSPAKGMLDAKPPSS